MERGRQARLRVSDVQLQFVVGKGGVGKSTLTAALALASASRGLKTLAVEFQGSGGVARLFGVDRGAYDAAIEVDPGLSVLRVEGDQALAEYLRMVVPIRRLLQAVFASRLYRVFVDAAPGLRELMTMGKVFYEAERAGSEGSRRWDRIFVDAGASGHSLQFLQMPSAAVATFPSGLVHREATRVLALLRDPERTCVHVVATPEEMPVTEASTIVETLRESLSLPLGDLFLNRCRPRPPSGAAAAVQAARTLAVAPEDECVRRAVVRAAESALGWEDVQAAASKRLERETGLQARRLPFVVREEFGLAEVREMAASLVSAKSTASRRRGRA